MIQTRKKLLAAILFLALIAGVAVAVFVSQKRQEIRQRANLEDQPSIYFTLQNSQTPIDFLPISSSAQTVSLYLNPLTNNITGFDITITAPSGTRFDQFSEEGDSQKFNTLLFKELTDNNTKIRFSKFNSNRQAVIAGNLHLATFTLTANSAGSLDIPTITVTKTCSTLPCSNSTISINKKTVTFIIPSPTVQPTTLPTNIPPTLIPTVAPTFSPAPNPNSVTYSLEVGKSNFIGIPVEINITPAELLNQTQGKCYSVIGFDASIGQARAYFSDPAKAILNTLTKVEGGKAYYVQCTQTASITLNGTSAITIPQIAQNISVGNVNYVAVPFTPGNAEGYMNSLNQALSARNIRCTRLGRFVTPTNIDDPSNNFEYYNPNQDPPSTTNVNFSLDPTKGYIATCK